MGFSINSNVYITNQANSQPETDQYYMLECSHSNLCRLVTFIKCQHILLVIDLFFFSDSSNYLKYEQNTEINLVEFCSRI